MGRVGIQHKSKVRVELGNMGDGGSLKLKSDLREFICRLEKQLLFQGGLSVHARNGEGTHTVQTECPTDVSVAGKVHERQGVAPQVRKGDVPDVFCLSLGDFCPCVHFGDHVTGCILQHPTGFFRIHVGEQPDLDVVCNFLALQDFSNGGVVAWVVVSRNDVEVEQGLRVDGHARQFRCGDLVGGQRSGPVVGANHLRLVERQLSRNLDGT